MSFSMHSTLGFSRKSKFEAAVRTASRRKRNLETDQPYSVACQLRVLPELTFCSVSLRARLRSSQGAFNGDGIAMVFVSTLETLSWRTDELFFLQLEALIQPREKFASVVVKLRDVSNGHRYNTRSIIVALGPDLVKWHFP